MISEDSSEIYFLAGQNYSVRMSYPRTSFCPVTWVFYTRLFTLAHACRECYELRSLHAANEIFETYIHYLYSSLFVANVPSRCVVKKDVSAVVLDSVYAMQPLGAISDGIVYTDGWHRRRLQI